MAKVEKEKKEKEAQSRSRNLMASFFGKPKAPSAGGSGTNSAAVKAEPGTVKEALPTVSQDRKSTRLNSSHSGESRMPSSA